MPGLDIHCGIWLGLQALGIESAANAGTSAGAIIGALNSAGWSAEKANSLLLSLSDCDVRRERFAWKLRVPWISYWLESAPITRVLAPYLTDEWRHLRKPFWAAATRETDAMSVLLDEREHYGMSVLDAVCASMAIAGIFEPIRDVWSDGGTTATLPVPWREMRTYDEVWLLIAARPLRYQGRGTVLTRLIRNIDLLLNDQIADTINRARASHPCVRVIWPDVQAPRGMLHFDHSLIETARQQAIDFVRRTEEVRS